jgi:hypothetical protein
MTLALTTQVHGVCKTQFLNAEADGAYNKALIQRNQER